MTDPTPSKGWMPSTELSTGTLVGGYLGKCIVGALVAFAHLTVPPDYQHAITGLSIFVVAYLLGSRH